MKSAIFGFLGVICGGLILHFSQKKLDLTFRKNKRRQCAYEAVNQALAGLFSGADQKMKDNASESLPNFFRDLQIWASDDVVRKFTNLMKVINKESSSEQSGIDLAYKEVVIAMRKDLLETTELTTEDIYPVTTINIS